MFKKLIVMILALLLTVSLFSLPLSALENGDLLINVFDSVKATNGWVNSTGSSSDASFKTSDFISVAIGDVITFGAAVTTQGWHLVTYNGSKTAISEGTIHNGITKVADLDNETAILTYTVPAGVSYVRMIADTRYVANYLVTVNQKFSVSDYNAYFGKEENPVNPELTQNPLKGKTALFVGDSICYGQWDDEPRKAWAGRIADQYGLIATNASIGGTTLSNVRENRIVSQLHNNKSNSYDYVILQGGTNDGWGNMASTGTVPAKVGTMSASYSVTDFDISTFAGGLEELFYYAFTYFPNAKIGFLTTFATPLGGEQNLGATGDMSAYYDMALTICKKWNVQVLDLFHDRYVSNTLMQITTYNCLRDPLHPNAKGYDNLAPYIGEWMTRMVDTQTYKTKPYTNQRALFVGDSISYGHNDTPQGVSWAGRLEKSMGLLSDNQSKSGWSVSTIRAAQIVQQLEAVKNKQYDYVIMQGGINDSWDNAPVGTVTNSYNPKDFDRTTYAGALEHLFYHAYQYFPNAKLGYLINFKLPAAPSDMEDYYTVALQICQKWKVPCYDMHNDPSLNQALNAGTLENMFDVGHPNAKGYDIITPYIENWLKTVEYADISSFESKMPALDSSLPSMPVLKNGILHINQCESVNGWVGSYNTTLSLSTETAEGKYALALQGGNYKISDTHYVGAMATFTFPQSADLSDYDTIAFDYYLGKDMTGKSGQLQLNFATNGEDGYNTILNIDNQTAGWHTATFSSNDAALKAVDYNWESINKLRFTWWNLNNSVADGLTVMVDNIRMYNASTLKEKEERVQELTNAIDAIGLVSAENYQEKGLAIEQAETMLASLIATYGESISTEIPNLVTLVRARETYNDFVANPPQKEPNDPTPPVDDPNKPENPAPRYGDVNDDEKINAKDALMILQHAVEKITLTEEQLTVGDVNGDTKADAKDALLVLRKTVESIDKFPVEQ